jgi:hypothetical protein
MLVFVLLTCVLSASIKERMETAATERANMGENAADQAKDPVFCRLVSGYVCLRSK